MKQPNIDPPKIGLSEQMRRRALEETRPITMINGAWVSISLEEIINRHLMPIKEPLQSSVIRP